jgi:hypothetical protein
MTPVYLDLESIPSQSADYRSKVREGIKPPGTIKKPESILQWLDENAESATNEAVAKTSFDPAYGHICCLSYAIDDGPIEYFEARKVEDERHILESFYAALPKVGRLQFIGHNIAGFDLRFILCRSIVLGVRIPSVIPRDIKPWSQEIFDTMTAWAGARGTISQDRLCEALGIAGKDGFDGSMVAEAWANGEYEKISMYCRADVEKVRAIHKRFELVGF